MRKQTSRQNPGILMSVRKPANPLEKAVTATRAERLQAVTDGITKLRDAGVSNSLLETQYAKLESGTMLPGDAENLKKAVMNTLRHAGLAEPGESLSKSVFADSTREGTPIEKAVTRFASDAEIAARAESVRMSGYTLPAFSVEPVVSTRDYMGAGEYRAVMVDSLSPKTSAHEREELCKSILVAEGQRQRGEVPVQPIKSAGDLDNRVDALRRAGVSVPNYSLDFIDRLNRSSASQAEIDTVCKSVLALETVQMARKMGLQVPEDTFAGVVQIEEPATPTEAVRRGYELLSKGVPVPGLQEFGSALDAGRLSGGLFRAISKTITQAETELATNALQGVTAFPRAIEQGQDEAQGILPTNYGQAVQRGEALLSKGIRVPELFACFDKFNDGRLTPDDVDNLSKAVVSLEKRHGIAPTPTSTSASGDTLLKAMEPGEPVKPRQATKPTAPAAGAPAPVAPTVRPQGFAPTAPTAPKPSGSIDDHKLTAESHGLDNPKGSEMTSEKTADKPFAPKPLGVQKMGLFQTEEETGTEPGGAAQHPGCKCVISPATADGPAQMYSHGDSCPKCLAAAKEFNQKASDEFNANLESQGKADINSGTPQGSGIEPMEEEV